MHCTLARRITVALAAVGLTVAGAVFATQPASAVSGAASCLAQLSKRPTNAAKTVVMTTSGSLSAATANYNAPLCTGMSVSIGISRTNTRDFRNQNTNHKHAAGNAYYFSSKFALGRADYGDWMTRQIAVKDKTGKLAVKTFTSATTPHITRAKFASVLTGTPTGRIRQDAQGWAYVKGSLKAWHHYGRLVNVQNQQVLVQVKRPNSQQYEPWPTVLTMTSRTGTFAVKVGVAGLTGRHVRIAFISKIPTVASDYFYLGKVV
jgi:hypothetical protein